MNRIKHMTPTPYLMENEQEGLRMEIKTDSANVEKQALWAGIRPGMRVADIGCGPGLTTNVLHRLVQPGGRAIGVDFSESRIAHAKTRYKDGGAQFLCRNILEDLSELGPFDFIWVRFFLEYHLARSFEIVRKLTNILAPGGILCLIDLDHNCMNHFKAPQKLIQTMHQLMAYLSEKHDFDPYAGRKLYAYLYDLNYEKIDISFSAHHLIYGNISESDLFNWKKKVKVIGEQSGFDFEGYENGFEGFYEEFIRFFKDPKRFSYTPVICCRGKKRIS